MHRGIEAGYNAIARLPYCPRSEKYEVIAS